MSLRRLWYYGGRLSRRVPMLVIPYKIDQGIWGKVAQLSVGPRPIPRPRLKVDAMAAALRQMQSPEMRQKAAALGAAIRAELDGVTEAVRLIKVVGAERQ